MVSISLTTVEVNSPQVRLKETVRLDSPNYLILYLDISESEPGRLTSFSTTRNNAWLPVRAEGAEPDRLNIESFTRLTCCT